MTSTQPTPTQVVTTPTAGRVLRRALFWIGVAAFAVVIGIISLISVGSSAGGPALDPTNAAPAGGMAVAEVLSQRGVDVVATSNLDDTIAAITSPATTTLLIVDNESWLDAARVRQAVALADTVIVANPDFSTLRTIAPQLAQAGYVNSTLTADCDIDVVRRAGTVSGTGSGFRVIDASSAVTPCLGSGDDVYSLVELTSDSGTLWVLGATGAISNESVSLDGNAAFALGLLGQQPTLVWYLPSLADLDEASPDTIASLTPAWVVPVMLLLALTVIAAAVWRGRRLGPLVIENLPVTVRASETMQGRARLYERSSSRVRAIDSLRIGTIQRLATACGLPRTATVDDVVAAVSSVTGGQVADIRAVLVDNEPTTDRDLIAHSDALLTLERRVAHAIVP